MSEFNKSIDIIAKNVDKLEIIEKVVKEIHIKISKTDEKVKAME
ncbi:hypothetical protein CI610_02919 [invertebrate metagenome]|uniref:Uncharacterized protein n=1 Tax=invertebrate metagenome TaxID=1711999 RepID=A0A2H9T4I6_9ZZZZ